MGLKAKATTGGGGDFERCPVGNHPAVCAAVIGAGTHTQQFQGKPPKDEEKVIIVWEVEADDPQTKESKRYFILKDYNLYFNEKSNLRKLVEGWFPAKKFSDGEDVDLTKLAGKACLLTVAEKDGYSRVDAAKPLVKGMAALKPSVPAFTWDVGDGTPYPSPAWVPYIWGKPMADYIRESHEVGGGKDRPLTEDGEAAESFPHGANEPSLGERAAEVF